MSYNKLSKIPDNVYKPLGEVVYSHLRRSIIAGELTEGERLMEIQIAEALGVSRTPVRDAMKKLKQEGFIEVVPRKGAYVKHLSEKDILDVLEIRRVLESFSVERAAVHATKTDIKKMSKYIMDFEDALTSGDWQCLADLDESFHGVIYGIMDNSKLKDLIQGLHDHFHRFRTMYYNTFDDYNTVLADHKQILEAIIAQDIKRAKRVTENHIDGITHNVTAWFNEQREKK